MSFLHSSVHVIKTECTSTETTPVLAGRILWRPSSVNTTTGDTSWAEGEGCRVRTRNYKANILVTLNIEGQNTTTQSEQTKWLSGTSTAQIVSLQWLITLLEYQYFTTRVKFFQTECNGRFVFLARRFHLEMALTVKLKQTLSGRPIFALRLDSTDEQSVGCSG